MEPPGRRSHRVMSNLSSGSEDLDDQLDDESDPNRFSGDSDGGQERDHLKRDRYPSSSESSASSGRKSQSDEEVAAITSQHTTIPSGFGGGRTKTRPLRKRPRPSNHFSTSNDVEANGDTGAGAGTATNASWERHTRGIGSKILAKLGFSGRLGKNEDGLTKPLEPRVRPRLAGVGLAPRATISSSSTKRRGVDAEFRKGKEGERDEGSSDNSEEDSIDLNALLNKQRLEIARNKPKQISQQSEEKKKQKSVELPSQETVANAIFSGARVVDQIKSFESAAASRGALAARKIDAERAILASARDGAERCERLALQAKERKERALKLQESIDSLAQKVQSVSVTATRTEGIGVNAVEKVIMVVNLASTFCNSLDWKYISGLMGVARLILSDEVRKLAVDASERGVANRKKARHISEALSAIRSALYSNSARNCNDEDYARMITHVIVKPIQRVIEAPGWDCVRGAAVADILTALKENTPRAALQSIGVSVSQVLTESSDGGTRMAVMPWVAVLGRRAMTNSLQRKRVEICKTIARWRLTCQDSSTSKLVSEIEEWLPVLPGRGRVYAAVAQYPFPQICDAIAERCKWDDGFLDQELSTWFSALPQSKSSATRHLVVAKIGVAIFNGPANAAKDAPDWQRAVDVYSRVRAWIPDCIREALQGPLAALLFVIHAKRVCAVPSWSGICLSNSLLRNCFSGRAGGTEERDRGDKDDEDVEMKDAEDAEASTPLIDVVEMVGLREGISVVRLAEHDGVTRVRFGKVEALVGALRDAVVVNGRSVSVSRLIEMGSHARGV